MPTISVVITTYNERSELLRTIESIAANTLGLHEIVVVDDGSTDGECNRIENDRVRVIRNSVRTGIAFSRNRGSQAATGEVLCYLDSHQRVSRGCLDRCAAVALKEGAIVCPDLRDYGYLGWRLHGADFELCPRRGFFSARWRRWFQIARQKRVTGLKAPTYLIPASIYPSVAWCTQLRGWGASEACVGVKAFFTDVPIVHLRGPLSLHRFRPKAGESKFPVTWEEIYRNQAIIARVCFDEATWQKHWLPLFDPHLTDMIRLELNSPAIAAERAQFQKLKRKTDRQFWTELVGANCPAGL